MATDESRTTRAAFPEGRLTQQRRAIVTAVSSFPGAFTAEDLAARLDDRRIPCGSTATVYRAIAAMEASTFLARVGSRDGSALYARCDASGHHHHVVCDRCGRIAAAECPLSRETTTSSGFRVTRHEVTLYGLCPECVTAMED